MSYLLINNRGGEIMKEKLPKVYVNKFEKKISNSREVVDVKKDKMDLDKLMAKNQYAFNHRYQILTKDKVIESSIIRKDILMDTIDAKKYLEIKILSGDDSDNINGCVLPGKKQQISVKKATELFESTGYMYKTSTVDGWDNQYIRNRNLIDMSCLPNDYYKKIQCALDKDDIVLDEWECVYSLNIPEKMINEINSMRNIGYYVMHDIAAVDSDIDLFKEHLVAKSETPVITEPIAYKFGVAGIFGQSY
jgi:5'-3' exonuclease